MADYFDRRKQAAANKDRQEPAVVPKQLEKTPLLAKTLIGRESSPGTWEKGWSVLLFWADEKLKFLVNDVAGGYCGWGVVKGDKPLAQAIEDAMQGDEIEWKEAKNGDKRR